ncbi:MAG TPA: Hsp20/alpha crystallin family protein [Verrucomicrobiae bacterium]|nr:Hsp20/alpha crystallin family protein [Verrucomicrobiae bacterium]
MKGDTLTMSNVATQEKRTVRDPRDQSREARPGWIQPQVNITEGKDSYLLEAEMPGVSKDGLEILLEGNELTIIGRRSHDTAGAQLVYRESIERDFRRSFELDPTIDVEKISARMESGVLYLTLPKAEQVKPRKIAVE